MYEGTLNQDQVENKILNHTWKIRLKKNFSPLTHFFQNQVSYQIRLSSIEEFCEKEIAQVLLFKSKYILDPVVVLRPNYVQYIVYMYVYMSQLGKNIVTNSYITAKNLFAQEFQIYK